MADIDPGLNFTQLLSEGRHADFLDKINVSMSEIAGVLAERDGTGTLTIKVSFKASDGMIDVTPQLNVKMPATTFRASHLFVTEQGHFTRKDPRQKEFGLVIEGSLAERE